MVSTSPLAQRIGVLSLKQSLTLANVKGLFVGSLIAGGAIVLFNEALVYSATHSIRTVDSATHPITNAQFRRATLIPRQKPDFVKRWEAKYGIKQE